LRLFCVVFFDGQHFAKVVVAVTANVFVERHNSSFWLVCQADSVLNRSSARTGTPLSLACSAFVGDWPKDTKQGRKEPMLKWLVRMLMAAYATIWLSIALSPRYAWRVRGRRNLQRRNSNCGLTRCRPQDWMVFLQSICSLLHSAAAKANCER
jgi:hypothetical protein